MALKASNFVRKGKGKSKKGKSSDSLIDWIGKRRNGMKSKPKKGSKPVMEDDDDEEC